LLFREAGRSIATALSADTASSYWPRAERRLISRWVICCMARQEYCGRGITQTLGYRSMDRSTVFTERRNQCDGFLFTYLNAHFEKYRIRNTAWTRQNVLKRPHLREKKYTRFLQEGVFCELSKCHVANIENTAPIIRKTTTVKPHGAGH